MNNYKDIRHLIKHGDTFATASPALFSRLIRFFTRSKVSHVGVFVNWNKRWFIVESMEGSGTRIVLASERFLKEGLQVYRGGKLSPSKVAKDLGADYDLKGALLAKFFDTKSSRNFCSEAVAKWLGLDFSHLNRGVLPSDICTKLNRIV
jgi:hypothetical protein